jgi:RNA polymerase sigma factor (sigma-70 family)
MWNRTDNTGQSWQDLSRMFTLAQQGDQESREHVFSFLRSRFLSVANHRLRDGAEDVVHETLIVVHNHFSEIANLGGLVAFSNQVLRNKIGNVYQSRGRRKEGELGEGAEPQYDINAGVEGGEMERIVRQSIETLGEKRTYCRAILLCLYQGWSPTEISGKLGIPKPRLKIQTFRCREALREILARRYGLQV